MVPCACAFAWAENHVSLPKRRLYRLSKSQHSGSFVLKGAALFTLWTDKPHRATRDVDLLGFGAPTADRIRYVLHEVLSLDVADDGVRFDPSSLEVGPIREEQEYIWIVPWPSTAFSGAPHPTGTHRYPDRDCRTRRPGPLFAGDRLDADRRTDRCRDRGDRLRRRATTTGSHA